MLINKKKLFLAILLVLVVIITIKLYEDNKSIVIIEPDGKPHKIKILSDKRKPTKSSIFQYLQNKEPKIIIAEDPELPLQDLEKYLLEVNKTTQEENLNLSNKSKLEIIYFKEALQNNIINKKSKYSLQLSLITNPNDSYKIWKNLQNKYKILSSYNYKLKKNIIDEQVFFHILAGEFDSFVDAYHICRKLNSMKENCIIVKSVSNNLNFKH